MKKRVLGIDPGTAIVGYSIVETDGKKYNLLDYGCIYTTNDDDMPERLNKIYDHLESIINIWKPDQAAIEELFFFKNQKTVIKVGQARGVISLVCKKLGLEIFDYTPLQVKMGITGYGKSNKNQVQEMVKQILNLEEIPKPDDAADAIAIAITHINNTKNQTIFTKINTDNFKKKTVKDLDTKKVANKLSLAEYKELMKKVKK